MYFCETQQPAWPFPEKRLPAEATKAKQPEIPFFAALYQPTSSSVKSWNLSTLFWNSKERELNKVPNFSAGIGKVMQVAQSTAVNGRCWLNQGKKRFICSKHRRKRTLLAESRQKTVHLRIKS
jgi:hypothetical protein